MVGLTDTFVANGAGHSVGDTVPPSRLYGSVLIAEILVENATEPSPSLTTGSRPNNLANDLATLVLHDHTESLTLLLCIQEALETLLLALDSPEGLCSALGELGGELVVVERGGTEVVALHLGYAGYPQPERKFVLATSESVAYSPPTTP